MKLIKTIGIIIGLLFNLISCNKSNAANSPSEDIHKVIIAYVTSWSSPLPNPSLVTHVNYSFGHVNQNFNGVRIDNENRLKEIVALKRYNPELKVLLSIGGWGSGNFSEMAADENNRKSFAADCARILNEYNLDGIDIDWEYPGSSAAGISSSENDRVNYTLLMKDIRSEIGNDKLLTLASVCSADYIDFRSVMSYVDFVNIMAYDMANAPYHHAPLYKSENTTDNTCDSSVKAHIADGVPAGRLVLGMPFYGRGLPGEPGGDYKNIEVPEGYSIYFDPVAMVPFLKDPDGNIVLGFDNRESLAAKCQYVKDNGLLGAMYWDYAGDNNERELATTVYNCINKQEDLPHVLVLNEGGGQHRPFTSVAMDWLLDHSKKYGYIITELRNANPITKEFLKDYSMVIQLDFPPYTWPEEAQDAFIDYIDNGKGNWIGFHHASLLGEFDGFPMWNWFSEFLGDIQFQNYIAPLADGEVNLENTTHPVMKGVEKSFILQDDEWYTYNKSPRPNVEVLASVDENSYSPMSEIKMGDHPVIWTNPDKKARNVYFQFGHSPKLFNSENFKRLFSNAIIWGLSE